MPAGLYAKAALEKLGSWAAAEPKLAQAENVRATLAFVARGETPIGIVYETDAKVEPKVKIAGVFPDNSYPPVTYPVAATANAKLDAVKYLQFLRGKAAKAIFEKYGFSFLGEAGVVTKRMLDLSSRGMDCGRACRCAWQPSRPWCRCRSASRLPALLARKDFYGKTLLNAVIYLPLVLPPVVTGYLLLIAFGRRGRSAIRSPNIRHRLLPFAGQAPRSPAA